MGDDDASPSRVPTSRSASFEVGYAKLRAPPALVVALGAPLFAALIFLLFMAPGTVTVMAAAMAAGALAFFARRMPIARGALEVGEHDVTFGGERLASLGDLSAAVVVVDADETRVELRSKKRSLATLHLGEEGEARRLVEALGFAPGGRVAAVEIPGSPWARAFALAVTLGAAALGGGELAAHARLPLAILWAAVCMLAAVVAEPLTKQLVEIGSDGLRITSRGRERFIPFSEIDRVTVSRGPIASIRLRLVSGKSVRLELATRPGANKALAAGLADLVNRAKSRATTDAGTVSGRLDRRGRETRAWLSDLRALGAGADADHRRAPATDDALWRAVTSPESAGVARAAAAVALAGDSQRKGELLRVAESVASPRLRVAIARAAESDDDDAIAEALLDLEREEVKSRRFG